MTAKQKQALHRAKLKRGGKAPRKKPGPPPIPIDWAKVANLCAADCSGATIAHELGIAPDTLYLRCQRDNGSDFSAFRLKHRMRGDDILRLRQFKLAEGGDVIMLKWLGKNRLGQRERVEHTGLNVAPPVINIVLQAPGDDEAGD